MESAQRALLQALLSRLRTLDLIPDAIYTGAMERLGQRASLPVFFSPRETGEEPRS
jgi:hypothetical protein